MIARAVFLRMLLLCVFYTFLHTQRGNILEHWATVMDQKYFHKNQFSHRLQCFFQVNLTYFMALFFKRITVLVESYMNCASNVFVSYRLFILYPKSMPSKLTFEFLVTVFATSSLTSVETCCFQFFTKFGKLPFKTKRTEEYLLHFNHSKLFNAWPMRTLKITFLINM